MRRALAVLLSLSLAVVSHAATRAPGSSAHAPADSLTFRLEHALTLNSFGDSPPQWSRDGRRLAFVTTAVDTAEDTNNPDLWIADVPTGAVWQLTRNPKSDISPTFSPGGDTLAFVSTRGTGDDVKPSIWMLSLRGGEPWAFGSYAEAVSEVTWSPDGKILAFVMLDTLPKPQREWKKKKWDQVIEDQRLQYPALWVVEVATGKQRRLTSGENFVWHVRWAPDSRSLAFLVSPTGRVDDANLADIGVVAASGGPIRKLGVIGASFVWSPDGHWVALATQSDRSKHVAKSDLYVVPIAGGSPLNLTSDLDADASVPGWNPTSDTLFFHVAQGVSSVVAAVPRAGGSVTLGLDREGEAGTPFAAPNGSIAWVQSQPLSPPEIWIADHPELPGRKLTSLNAALARLDLASTRSVRWTSSDGVKIEGLLVRPYGARPSAALKTLVLLHGGPYTARYARSFQPVPQYFAAHGYQVFMPNFRSSGGYGTAFMMRKRSDWGGQDWRDVMSGVDSLVKWGLADGLKLGVFGHSYGGYLSAWAITQTSRFDAACVSAGAVDLASLYGQSDTHQYRAFEFDGTPWETPDNWSRSSPFSYIRNVKTPTLILIGESDQRIPYPQGQQLYHALSALGVPTEFVHYPREGHGLREPHHRADEMMRMLAWWDRWIK